MEFAKVFFTILGIGLVSSAVPFGPMGVMMGWTSVVTASLACTALYFYKGKRRKAVALPNEQFWGFMCLALGLWSLTGAMMLKTVLD